MQPFRTQAQRQAALINAAEDAKPQKLLAQSLRGMKDSYGDEQAYWQWMESIANDLAASYRFEKIELPIVESTTLFARTIGKATDIVEKEMFSFVDKGGDHVTLRPEATASIARAYVQHGMLNLPQPVRLWYWGPMFRHERPQSGRLRQFFQYGCEIIGDATPMLDALTISTAFAFCRALGLETSIHINSIGCSVCRPQYIEELVAFYRSRRGTMCLECKKRIQKNPLRVLDCKEQQCLVLREEAPQFVDSLCEQCKDHFMKTLEYCDELEIPYQLQPTLVRGLDYYTKTVFELYESTESGRQDALGGGGRYDGLVEMIGGRPTPAVGFALGVERIVSRLRAKGIAPQVPTKPEIFVAQLGEAARRKALRLFGLLRAEGYRVAEAFSKDGLKPQLEIANALKVSYTVIIGQKEVLDQTVLVRDMDGGSQEIVEYDMIVKEMRSRLRGNEIRITKNPVVVQTQTDLPVETLVKEEEPKNE